MIKKMFIAVGVLIGLGFVGFIAWNVVLVSAFGLFDEDYSVSELKDNFYSREVEIRELKRYYNSIVPPNKSIEIEFENNKTLGRFGIETYEPEKKSTTIFLDWNIAINSNTTDSLLNTIGWTQNNLKELKKKLDNANCIQIKSGEPTTIGFKRSGLGMYFFNVFDEAIPESLKSYYNDGCRYILADEKLVLEYVGGAVGAQCFYNLK